MRVSVDEADSGYVNLAVWRGASVYVDGAIVTRVIMADTDAGEVIRSMEDERGMLVVHGGEIATETLRGHVEIVKP